MADEPGSSPEDDEYRIKRERAFHALVEAESSTIFDYGVSPQHEYYGDIEFERTLHRELSIRAGNFLIVGEGRRLALELRVIVVRCREHGCYLADVYRFPLREGERYLAMTNVRRGRSHAAFLNWAFSDEYRCMPGYLPSGCRHGTARLGTGWLFDCVGAHRRWKHGLETVEEFEWKLPPDIYNGRNSGVFHPPRSIWQPTPRTRPVR
ncbi:hypothetical protein [Pseudonocardia hydrocarbonoxydans]|uniref:Uncharacterized protein n=1 Tax=Pseudonocardia hydrocarbonoxydans TaxID=76726 RepID=A0A4Y3WRJ8_9PSEU|nr:hypothetical protein [Pseudonocardia hydrocarbonoxydans]GEC19986.1 hypothetical protein PHY01_22690 [Pseudonocardia hydrocarbonoxydans]